MKKCFNYSTLEIFLNGMKLIYFINLLIIIVIKSYEIFIIKFFDLNNLIIKPIINFFPEMLNNLLFIFFHTCCALNVYFLTLYTLCNVIHNVILYF